jgi:aspartate 1-decarboxylase
VNLHLLKSKLHRVPVTDANVDYEGSLSIDRDFMDEVGLLPYERILCTNAANAARFETYAIPAARGSRQIVLNGAAAHLGTPGDLLTIMSFAEVDAVRATDWFPRIMVFGKIGGDRRTLEVRATVVRPSP